MTSQDKEIILDNRIYKVFFAPLKTEDEKAYGIVMLFTEITETVELDKMRKRFVADVSHELKTPLAIMKGYLDILQWARDDKDLLNEAIENLNLEVKKKIPVPTPNQTNCRITK